MTRFRYRLWVFLFCTSTSLGTLPAVAAEAASNAQSAPTNTDVSAQNERVRELFRQGADAFDKKEFSRARSLWLEAWSLRQTYDVATALGQVELELGLPREAAQHLDFALRNFPPQLSANALERLRKMFARAASEVGALDVQVARAGAAVLVDSKAVGTTPLASPVFLTPGTHIITVRSGADTASRPVTVNSGDHQLLVLELPARTQSEPVSAAPASAETSPATPSSAPPSPPPTEAKSGLTPPLIAGAAVTVVGASAGVLFALLASHERDRADTFRAEVPDGACSPALPSNATCTDLRHAAEAHDRDRVISISAFVVSGAAAVGTAVYWVTTRSKDANRIGGLERGVRIAPAIGARSAAVSVLGVW